MTDWQIPLVERAKRIAEQAHSKQTRKGSGVPYITHLQHVVEILHEADEITRAAGWLHDIIEDTPYTRTDVEYFCGKDVANVVMELTERKRDVNGDKRPWKARKDEVVAAVPNLSQAAADVRAADVLSNFVTVLEDVERIGEKVWDVFAVGKADSLWYYHTMFKALIPRMQRADLRLQLQSAVVVVEMMLARVPK